MAKLLTSAFQSGNKSAILVKVMFPRFSLTIYKAPKQVQNGLKGNVGVSGFSIHSGYGVELKVPHKGRDFHGLNLPPVRRQILGLPCAFPQVWGQQGRGRGGASKLSAVTYPECSQTLSH